MNIIARAVSQAASRASCTGIYSEAKCEPVWLGSETKLAALIVTKGWWESRFASNVHRGKCRPDQCDPMRVGKVIIHKARSPWQLQRTGYSESMWANLVGAELKPTRNAAWVAAKILSEGKRRCRSYYGALAWYGVQRCDWSGASGRYTTYKKLVEATESAEEQRIAVTR